MTFHCRIAAGFLLLAPFVLAPAHAADSVRQTGIGAPGSDQQGYLNYVLEQRSVAKEVDDQSAARIYGGRPAKEGAWPFQVSLILAKPAKAKPRRRAKFHFCGGSIIARQWILTAAHCIFVKPKGAALSPAEILVKTGSNNLMRGELREVSKIITHPDYGKGSRYNNDIALLKLASPITSSAGQVGAIRVANAAMNLVGSQSVILGWGMMENDHSPINLMETDINIVTNKSCATGMARNVERRLAADLSSFGKRWGISKPTLIEFYKKLVPVRPRNLTANMMCAGVTSGSNNSCKGDSGGPLLIRGKDGKWTQVGIVSFGAVESNSASPVPTCGVPQAYSVYTRVSRYFKWIGAQVKAGS